MKHDAKHWDRVKERTMSGKVSARIKKLYEKGDPIKVILYNNLCPGDILLMEPSIRMIHEQYPGRYITDVACFHPSIFDHNPYITKLDPQDSDVVHLWTTYPLVNKSNQRPISCMEAYLDWFRTQLDVDLVLDTNRPFIYLSEQEKKKSIVEEMYGIKRWIVCTSGWKNDYTCKRWSVPAMNEVIKYFKDKIPFVQTGLTKPFHNHPRLDNVLDLIDKTNIRQLIVACYHSQAGIGPVTCIKHMYGSFRKPFICLAGGREPPTWHSYCTERVFHNIGTLECNAQQACWISRIIKLNDNDKKDNRLCKMPMVDTDGRAIAKCMLNIKPNQVIEAIEAWIDGGIIKV